MNPTLLSFLVGALLAGEERPLLTAEPAVAVTALDRDATRLVERGYSYGPPSGGDWKPVPDAPIRTKAEIVGDARFYCPLSLNAVGASPDGKWLVYGVNNTHGNPLFVYDRATGKEAFRLWGHDRQPDRFVFSPDGSRLYSGAGGNHIIGSAHGDNLHIWDVVSRKLIAVLPSTVWALTPDARTLVTVERLFVPSRGDDLALRTRPVVRVRDTKDWKSLNDYAVNGFHPAAVAVTPDAKVLGLGGAGGTVHLWDRVAGKELASLAGVSEHVSVVAFSPDGKLLAAGGLRQFGPERDEPIFLWDWSANKVLHRLRGHRREVRTIAFSPDGKHLISCDGATVTVWDVAKGTAVAERALLSSNPGFVATAAGLRVVWPKVAPGRPALVSFPELKDAPSLAKAEPGPVKLPFETVERAGEEVPLPDGTTLRAIKLDTEPGLRIGIGLYKGTTLLRAFEKDRVAVFDADPKGKLLAAASRPYDTGGGPLLVRLWDVATGKEAATLRYYPSAYYALRFAPDGNSLAILHQDGFIRLWNVKTLKPILALDARWYPGSQMAFSKDGRKLVVGNKDAAVATVWDVTTGDK
jgi:WD40 repeat protein